MSSEIFKVVLNTGYMVVKDHCILGTYVFPGAGLIEMALANLDYAECFSPLKVRNIVIHSPLILEEGQDKIVNIEYKTVAEGKQFCIFSPMDEGEVIRHIEGRICFDNAVINEGLLAVEKIMGRCHNSINHAKYYDALNNAGLQYGPFFKTLGKLNYNNDEVVAELCSFAGDYDADYILNPAILDGAFQALGIFSFEDNSKYLYLPYYLEKISIGSVLPTRSICYGKARPDNRKDSPLRKYDLKICNLDGQVLIDIEGLCLKSVPTGPGSVGKPLPKRRTKSGKMKDKSEKNLKASIQKIILSIISEIIKVEEKELDIFMPFQEFGLDSIIIGDVLSLIDNRLDIQLEPTLFFEYKTVEELSVYIAENYNAKLDGMFENSEQNMQPEKKENVESAFSFLGNTGYLETGNVTEAVYEKTIDEVNQTINISSNEYSDGDIAVIGYGGRFPGAENMDEYWDNIVNGRCSVLEIPDDRWDWRDYYKRPDNDPLKIASKWGGFIKDIDKFDAAFFNICPAEARVMDPQQRLFLELSWEIFENAGYIDELKNSETGIFIGASYNNYKDLVKQSTDYDSYHSALGNSMAVLANRISYYYGLNGPSAVVDTLCSSSLSAVIMACESLRAGSCKMVLAGGVNIIIPVEHYIALSRLKSLATDGRCKSFSDDADGFVCGEGIGAVLLKRVKDAVTEGDRIYAIIKGYAMNHNGPSNGLMAPNPEAQKDVILKAYRNAGLSPEKISYLEAMSAGTKLGDPIEIMALNNAFSKYTDKKSFCALGCVKTNIGHLEPASGIAGLIKVILSLQYKKFPPLSDFSRPNLLLKLENSPFFIQDKLTDWKATIDKRRAAISSFGMGGTNTHIVVEEFDSDISGSQLSSDVGEVRETGIFTLSAKNEAALNVMLKDFRSYLTARPETDFHALCRTVNARRSRFKIRTAIVCSSIEHLNDKLELLCMKGLYDNGLNRFNIYGKPDAWKKQPGSLVFAFPGFDTFSGEEACSMLKNLYAEEPLIRNKLQELTTQLPENITEAMTALIEPIANEANKTLILHDVVKFLLQYLIAYFYIKVGAVPDGFVYEEKGYLAYACFAGKMQLEDTVKKLWEGKDFSVPIITRYSEEFQALVGKMIDGFILEFGINSGLSSYLNNINCKNQGSVCLMLKSANKNRAYCLLYETLALLYTEGIYIKWQEFNFRVKDTIPLPSYPFERNPYWVKLRQDGLLPSNTCLQADLNQAEGDTTCKNAEKKGDGEQVRTYSGMVACNEEVSPGVSINILISKLSSIFIEEIAGTMGHSENEIDVDTEFNELGFDSIFAEKVISLYNGILGINLNISILFDYTTISKFSSFLANNYYEQCRHFFLKELFPAQNHSHTLKAVEIIEDECVKINILQNKEDKQTPEKSCNVGDIAVIGLAGRFPGAENIEKFWENISQGICSIKEIPKERWDMDEYYDSDPLAGGKSHCRYGAFIDNIDKFDPRFFGISINKAALIDPQQRLMLETVWHAVEDAGYGNGALSGTKTGVYIGVCNNEYIHRSKQDLSKINPHIAAGNTFSAIANRISYCLNVKGPSIAIDTACSSSLVALYSAYKDLLSGECDFAIVGGVNLTLSPVTHIIFSKAQVLSPDGKPSAFDEKSNGYVRGEGVGALVLRRLDKAVEASDNVYAVIKSIAVGHTGLTNGLNTPSALSEKELVSEAYKKAGIEMDSISFIEAHGTGTSLGDTIEMRGLSDAFKERTKKRNFCAIGSVKNNIGHLEAAAGIAGIIKIILVLKMRQLPPNINFNTPSKKINFLNSPFYINDKLTHLEDTHRPLRAGVSAFGFGGTNAHAVLEEAPPQNGVSAGYNGKTPILTVSANNKESLFGMTANISNFISINKDARLEDICFTYSVGRSHHAYRLSVIVKSRDYVEEKLKQFLNDTAEEGLNVGMNVRKNPVSIFVFENSLLDESFDSPSFYKHDPEFRGVIDECVRHMPPDFRNQILDYYEGILTKQRCYNEVRDITDMTDSYALGRTLIASGIQPAAVASCGTSTSAPIIAGIVSMQDVVEAILQGKTVAKADSPRIPYIMVKEDGFFIRDTYEGTEYDLLSRSDYDAHQVVKWCKDKRYTAVRINKIRSVNDFVSLISGMYSLGVDIDWARYYKGLVLNRLSLPQYIFKKNSYWLN